MYPYVPVCTSLFGRTVVYKNWGVTLAVAESGLRENWGVTLAVAKAAWGKLRCVHQSRCVKSAKGEQCIHMILFCHLVYMCMGSLYPFQWTTCIKTETGWPQSCVWNLLADSAMVLSDYGKIRILNLWREGKGPTAIVEDLSRESIKTTRKTVTLFISRYMYVLIVRVCHRNVCKFLGVSPKLPTYICYCVM